MEIKDAGHTVKIFRELQGLKAVDLERALGFSWSSIGPFERGVPSSLSVERIESVLDYLNIEVRGENIQFKDDIFVKVVLKDDRFKLVDYSTLHFVLDMYKDRDIKLYVYRYADRNIIDRIAYSAYPVAPADAIFVRVGGNLFVVKRERYYLVDMRDEMARLKNDYKKIKIEELKGDVRIDSRNITRSGVERIIREAKRVESRGLKKR
ncbi:MAG: helix-turn-helix domain-containing protein [Dissulfurispiraceae bacterium]